MREKTTNFAQEAVMKQTLVTIAAGIAALITAVALQFSPINELGIRALTGIVFFAILILFDPQVFKPAQEIEVPGFVLA